MFVCSCVYLYYVDCCVVYCVVTVECVTAYLFYVLYLSDHLECVNFVCVVDYVWVCV